MPDNKCKWKPKFGYECNEPSLPYDPDCYCILHSKKEDKNIEQLKEKVSERIQKGRLTPAGYETDRVDLRGCYFPKTFPSNYFINSLRNNTFDKPVDFHEATFSQEAHFGGITFSQEADFWWAKFAQEAVFSDATFSQRAGFIEATFSQKAYFVRAAFSQGANFRSATFSQEVRFTDTIFSKETHFGGASFFKEAYFGFAKFSDVFFAGTTFERGVNFSWTEFNDRAYFFPIGIPGGIKEVTFYQRSLFKYVRFSEDVIFQQVDLSQCSFLHSNIDKVDFRYCKFDEKKNRLFRIICAFPIRYIQKVSQGKEGQLFRVIHAFSRYIFEVYWGKERRLFSIIPIRRQNVLRDELECEWKVKRAKRKIHKEEKKDREEGYEYVRHVYLELKRNYENKKDWNTAGDFHFGEMECRRQKMPCWKRYFWSLEFWYWLTSGYCERPLRAFIVLLGLVGVFSLLYMPTEEWNYFTSLRDSLNVAKLMRLGNSMGQDPGWGKFIVALFEIILVPIQTALLALALRRKVKR